LGSRIKEKSNLKNKQTNKTKQNKQRRRISKATRKAPGALDPAVVLSPLRVQNISWSLKITVQVVSMFEVGDLSYL